MENEFLECCSSTSKVKYTIEHRPKPIELSQDLLIAIEHLLWYVPNISSVQSKKHEMIEDNVYSDFCFSYILSRIGLSPSDVKWITGTGGIPQELIDKYTGEVCVNCQKLILKASNKTKTSDLLRHIRNCIAHGNFNVCGDMLIGFDTYKDDTTAIVKIRPQTLLNALKMLDHPITKEALFAYGFEKLGYHVERQQGNIRWDMVISKESRKYCVEIKVAKSKGQYIHEDEFSSMIGRYLERQMPSNDMIPVLIIDTGRLTVAAKKKFSDKSFKVIDINAIKQMLQGIDVLAEIV